MKNAKGKIDDKSASVKIGFHLAFTFLIFRVSDE
jgi:hypothetical protein